MVIPNYLCFLSVTVSVLSIEGTDCRLDELGRLADRTGGKVRGGVTLCCKLFVSAVSLNFFFSF